MNHIHLMCACGHLVTTTVELDDLSTKRATRNVTYRICSVCPHCFTAQGRTLKPTNGRTPLRRLTGSPYQVAWAKDIRQQHMLRFAELVRNHPTGIADDMLEAMIRLVNEKTSAGWWIDHQSNTFRSLIPYCHEKIRTLVIHAAFHTDCKESPRINTRYNRRAQS